ncbi:MAG: caspase family protein [Bacteroidota bacterium]
MKNRIYLFSVIILTAICFQVTAQSAEKSSGVIKLNMKKAPVRFNEVSPAVTIPMVQQESVKLNGEVNGFTWLAPRYTSVRTSESNFEIKATVNAEEAIRFVNLFNNGQFVTNIIPPVSTIKQMVVEKQMDLNLGINNLKIEAVTQSGKKIESSVEVVYDISSAKYFALVIAVEDYDDPQINDLDQPVQDATRFTTLINSKYNFEQENILFLKNPTKAEIIGTLHKMRKQVTPQDNLLIYYAGHGYWDEEMTTGYWLPKDASKDNPVDWLPNTDLTNYLNVLRSKHTLLIADACFSGGIFKSRAAFNNVMSIEKLYKLTSRKAITSGTLKEVPDKSVFIEYLIKRLDSNQKKYLPSEQLYSSMREAVINNSPNIPMYGTIQNVGDEGGDFIFIRRD